MNLPIVIKNELKGGEMNKIKVITNAFGLPQALNRPHIPATKELDLSGPEGQQIVKDETEKVLIKYSNTFKKLANM